MVIETVRVKKNRVTENNKKKRAKQSSQLIHLALRLSTWASIYVFPPTPPPPSPKSRSPCSPRLTDGGPHRLTSPPPLLSTSPAKRPAVSGFSEPLVPGAGRDGGGRGAPVAGISPSGRLCERWPVNLRSFVSSGLCDKSEKTMKDLQDCNSKSPVAFPGSLVLHLFRLFGQQDNSWQKYTLAYFLLVRNEYFPRESRKHSAVHCCDSSELDLGSKELELKKQNVVVKIQSGGHSRANRSNDCFLPGLHDDLAQDCLSWTSRSDYPSLSCLNKKFNLLINNGYLYKLRRKYGIVEHWVYLACSSMPWEAFDPSRRRWMRLPRLPCDECFSNADRESLAVGTQLLVFGREYAGLAIWMYNLLTRNWSRCTPMNLPRCLFASGSSGEIAIVAGGWNGNGQVLKSAELYNSETGHWETLPDMDLPRRLSSGFFMDGKFYVIGGVSSQSISLTCGEEYNLETRTWTRIHDMYPGGTSASQSPPLIAVVNNQLYAADQSTNVVKKYDKANNTWNIVKPLPVRADSSNGWGLAFKACGDKLLVIGGHRLPCGEVILLHSWCPEDGNSGADWEVLSVKERAGVFVHNCAIMGC